MSQEVPDTGPCVAGDICTGPDGADVVWMCKQNDSPVPCTYVVPGPTGCGPHGTPPSNCTNHRADTPCACAAPVDGEIGDGVIGDGEIGEGEISVAAPVATVAPADDPNNDHNGELRFRVVAATTPIPPQHVNDTGPCIVGDTCTGPQGSGDDVVWICKMSNPPVACTYTVPGPTGCGLDATPPSNCTNTRDGTICACAEPAEGEIAVAAPVATVAPAFDPYADNGDGGGTLRFRAMVVPFTPPNKVGGANSCLQGDICEGPLPEDTPATSYQCKSGSGGTEPCSTAGIPENCNTNDSACSSAVPGSTGCCTNRVDSPCTCSLHVEPTTPASTPAPVALR